MSMPKAVAGTLAVAGSLLAALFLVFGGLFTDGPQDPVSGERLVSLGLVLIAYAVVTGVACRWAGWKPAAWAAVLAAPGIAIALLYGPSDGVPWSLTFAYVAAVVLGTVAGTSLAPQNRPAA